MHQQGATPLNNPIGIRKAARAMVAAAAIAVLTFGAGPQPAQAGGIRNCVDLTGKQVNRVGCFENVWKYKTLASRHQRASRS